jgi:integration host factor subunit alpha
MIVTKQALANILVREYKLIPREAMDLVDIFFENIRYTLERDEEVSIVGFGKFYMRHKAPTMYKRATVDVDPEWDWRVPDFKPVQRLIGKAYMGSLDRREEIEEATNVDETKQETEL